MRQKAFYLTALLPGALLTMAVAVLPALAADPRDAGGNQSGVMPAAATTQPMSQYDLMRQVVPSAPAQPAAVSRPTSWPGGSTPASQPAAQAAAAPTPSQAPMVLFEGATIIARVGSEGIFADEIMGATIIWKNARKSEGGVICVVVGGIDEVLEPYKDKMSASQYESARTMQIKQRLINCVETKIIYLDAKQNFPAEHFSDVEKQLDKFYQSTALPALYKCCEVKSIRELDQKLRSRGLSLESARKASGNGFWRSKAWPSK